MAGKKTEYTQEMATILTLRVLEALAQDLEDLSGFLAHAGIGPQELRQSLAQASFQGALLDYVLSEPKLTDRLALELEIEPVHLVYARLALPGADPEVYVAQA
jgi:hypothetical protein